MSGLKRCWTSSASSVSQLLRSLLQLLKILGLGDLGHLARLLGLIYLDPQLLDLLLQALFADVDLADHPLEDPRELPHLVGAPCDVGQAVRLEGRGLDRRGRGRQA